MIDSGDLIRIKGSSEILVVACAHDVMVWPMGFPGTPLRLDDVELVERASESQRRAQIEALAQSSAKGHRSECARARLATTQA